jgi:SAM-dependent methyltransferase
MKSRKYIAMSIVFVVIIVAIAGVSLNRWRGGGFSATGPEMLRFRQVLNVKPGMSVADVGAGGGDVTLALAAEVGPPGRVFASDIDPSALAQIRRRVDAAGLRNVTLVEAGAHSTGLPENCCDAIVVRRVYHHLTDPAATNVSLLRALRPGGVLAVIDFPPLSWLWPLNHGVNVRTVTEEVATSGFQLVQVIEDWPGRGPLVSYCAVFRKAPVLR